jgi:hypothetical protein
MALRNGIMRSPPAFQPQSNIPQQFYHAGCAEELNLKQPVAAK